MQGQIIAINNAVNFCNPDAVVAIDKRWHDKERINIKQSMPIISHREIPGHDTIIIAVDPEAERSNMSGIVALDIAFKLGASRVYLLGFDGGYKDEPNFYENDNAASDRAYQEANIYYHAFRSAPVKLFGPTKITAFPVFDLDEYQAEFEADKYNEIWSACDYTSSRNSDFANRLINEFNIWGRCLEIGCGSGALIKELQRVHWN